MLAHQELPAQPPQDKAVLTVGVFDGVHLGHQHLLNNLKYIASQRGLLSGVITFVNHPRTILSPDTPVEYITTVDDRLALLKATGVDMVIPLTFDQELSHLGAHQFTDLLQKRLNMAGLVMGPNFGMGHGREGNPETLDALGQQNGFFVTIVEPLLGNGARVSSTAIREAISTGNVTTAAQYLGRPFALKGTVLPGDSRGKTLGFPTANVVPPGDLIVPGNGIYAAWAYVDGQRHMAATNVGTRPTFGTREHTIEAFLLDFSGDLYGHEVTVAFIQRLRDEMRFQNPDALIAQIQKDVEQTRTILGKAHDTVHTVL